MPPADATLPSAPEPAWTAVLTPQRGWFEIPWRELWRYRDLVALMAQRDLAVTYKQTVLGPVWLVLQPLLTTAAFSFLFGRLGGFGTDRLPPFLFYLSGLVIWNFLAECVNKTSHTFTRNAQLFGKVYFPRFAVPLSAVATTLASFGVQFALFLAGLAWFWWKGAPVEPSWRVIVLPLLLLQTAMLGVGIGCAVSALSTRFRDLALGVSFAVQLWMYASSIVFPISRIAPEYRWMFYVNPMVPVVEGLRFAFLGSGLVERWHLAVSFGVSAAVFALGVVLFHRAEQTVMDTV